ncbi:ABC transporter substrate-binding protein [Georgenia sp. Z1491]|uniref:ABC transporter substrate-binding protein n=1 Tax=Georgenia sp. Z1491 TaxID=3416707 RepID=UPI003CFA969F
MAQSKRTARAATGAAATAALVVLAACGGGDSAEGGGGDGEEGGALVIAGPEPLDNWDPLQQANPAYMSMVFDTLIAWNADGSGFEPMLATEWEQTPEHIEFVLRDDAVFHDGTPIDADAVVQNIERIRDTPHNSQAVFANVTEIVAVDETTVRLELSEPTGGILETLADWPGSIVAPATIEEGSFREPIGSAAFQYNADESRIGSEIVVDAFPDYYNADEVGPSSVTYLEMTEPEQRFNALQTGRANVIYGEGGQIDQAEAEGMDVVVYPKVQWAAMLSDVEGVFSDVNVRQAVCHGINSQQFLDAHYSGHGETASQIFREGTSGFNPDVDNLYPYDVDAAIALLEEAGNPDVEFTLPTPDEYQPIYQVFASQMEEIGITVNLDVMPFGEFISTYNNGEAPMILFSNLAAHGPYAYYLTRYAPESGRNAHGVEYPELLAAVQEGAAAEDEESAEESYQEFSRIALEEAYDCGQFYLTGIWISDPEAVSGLEAIPGRIDTFNYMDVEISG